MAHSNEKYLFVFASNYHGYYIEDLLRRNGITNTMRKAPRALGRSCNTAIYIGGEDFEKAMKLISQAKIKLYETYEIFWIGGLINYKKLAIE